MSLPFWAGLWEQSGVPFWACSPESVARFDSRRVAGDVTDEAFLLGTGNQRLMDELGQLYGGKLGEGTGDGQTIFLRASDPTTGGGNKAGQRDHFQDRDQTAGGVVEFADVLFHSGEKLTHPGALGWTHITEGEILPFIDIDCEGIRLVVQRDITATPVSGRDAIFGRAVSRVLAHESYHFLAQTKHHSGGGVAKASYTAEDLLAQTLRFGKKECAMLRNRAFAPGFP